MFQAICHHRLEGSYIRAAVAVGAGHVMHCCCLGGLFVFRIDCRKRSRNTAKKTARGGAYHVISTSEKVLLSLTDCCHLRCPYSMPLYPQLAQNSHIIITKDANRTKRTFSNPRSSWRQLLSISFRKSSSRPSKSITNTSFYGCERCRSSGA